jgi:hypothetical protein
MSIDTRFFSNYALMNIGNTLTLQPVGMPRVYAPTWIVAAVPVLPALSLLVTPERTERPCYRASG